MLFILYARLPIAYLSRFFFSKFLAAKSTNSLLSSIPLISSIASCVIVFVGVFHFVITSCSSRSQVGVLLVIVILVIVASVFARAFFLFVAVVFV